MSHLLRQLGLGRLAYHVWHAPTGKLVDLVRDGGPWQRRRTEAGRQAMELAAATLPAIPEPLPGSLPVTLHLLTGRKYWYQTAFCLWTFARHSRRALRPVILDDGSLTPAHVDALRRLFPSLHVLPAEEIAERLDRHLPVARFPALRARRAEFPLLRKLTDVHAGKFGWRLFIDSDLLFFRRPDFLLDWHDEPRKPLRGEDIVTAYGYPLEFLSQLAGRPVADRINTGTLGLHSESIDWEKLEVWCAALQRVGPHYYQEQALVALLLAGVDCAVPPPVDHVIRPLPPEAIDCRAVMHHYVAHSKRWYFQHCWQHALTR